MKKYTKTTALLKAGLELFPSLTSIFLDDLLLVYIFLNLAAASLSLEFFSYAFLEAASTLLVGKISDNWSRKKILLLVHFLVLPLLIILYIYIHSSQTPKELLQEHIYFLLAAGLVYNAGPPCRAVIVDNYKSAIIKAPKNNFWLISGLTETRLIAISWIAQYLPWILAPFILLISIPNSLLVLITLMILNIPLLLFRLKDTFEKSMHAHDEPLIKSFTRFPFTFLGLFLAQIVFWATFDKIDLLKNHSFIYSMVGIGATIGTVFSLFHKKTPHISVITSYYEFGIILSIISSIYSCYYDNLTLLTFQLIMISAIGGCYLPFVYDIVVNHSEIEHRGTMFACTEVVQGISAVFGMLLMTAAGGNTTLLFSITSVLFFSAHQLQAREKRR